MFCFFFFFSSRRRHTRCSRDWSSDVCSSDLLGCTNYPDCKKTMPMPGQELEAPELLDEKCPDCGNPLAKRKGRFGPFIGCSTYPECKYIQRKPRVSTGMPCPKCAE